MANPFQVTPPNVLQALLMGQQGFDTGRKSMQDAAMSEAGRLYAAGDVKGAQAAASRGGSLQALMGFANLQNNDRDFSFRQTEAQRAQQNADRGFGLQEKQVNATLGNSAASQALARAQLEFMKRPEVRDVNGVPMLVNRESGTMAPIGGMPAAPSNIPAGVDPATYKREQAQAVVKSETENKALMEGGQGVMAMVDQLERKISSPSIDPKTGARVDNAAQRFGAATGPFVAAASEASTWDPRKWAYEGVQSRESKAYLDQIKQDAQAINSTMQRALLKGGGAISDGERASINQILGQIAAARSPEDAKALLSNFRGIVRQMFKLPDAGQPAAAAQPAAAGNLPPLPPGFVVQQ